MVSLNTKKRKCRVIKSCYVVVGVFCYANALIINCKFSFIYGEIPKHFSERLNAMQLAITVLSDNPFAAISELIHSSTASGCRIVEVKSSRFSDLHCAYLLAEGSWNQLAKYESTLHAIEKKFHAKIHSHRIEKLRVFNQATPYMIEVVGLESNDILQKVVAFFNERNVDIEDISGRTYPAPYLNAQLFSARLIISISNSTSLFMLRDEIMYVCDQMNADIIFEPFGVNR
jgi:glycine cleavage system transcriptional repressor